MNSAQKRKRRRSALRMARLLVDILSDMIDDLESGKYTPAQMREQLGDAKKELAKLK